MDKLSVRDTLKMVKKMKKFTKDVIEIILQIPEGHVATYGQIAKLAGNKRASRQVARILHSMSSKYQLPWQRIINAKGKITIKQKEEQKRLLEKEGVKVGDNFFIDLPTYQWKSDDEYSDWMEG